MYWASWRWICKYAFLGVGRFAFLLQSFFLSPLLDLSCIFLFMTGGSRYVTLLALGGLCFDVWGVIIDYIGVESGAKGSTSYINEFKRSLDGIVDLSQILLPLLEATNDHWGIYILV
jgi:hypothetical protein